MLKNGIYNLLGGGTRLVLGIITVPLLLQILGLSQYGLYTMASALVSLAALAEWSIALTVTVLLAEDLKHTPQKARATLAAVLLIVLLLALTTGGVLLAISYGSTFFFHKLSPSEILQVNYCCRLGAIIVTLRLVQQFFVGFLQAHHHYGPANGLSTAYTLLLSAGTLAAAYYHRSITSIFNVQAGVAVLFVLIYAGWCYRIPLPGTGLPERRLVWVATQKVFQFSLRTWLGSFGGLLFTQGDRLLLGSILSSEAVGIYSAFTSVTYQINTISSLPLQPLVPEISQARTLTPERFSDTFNLRKVLLAYQLNIYLALLLGILLIGLSPEVLRLLALPRDNETFLNGLILLSYIYTLYSFNCVGYYVLLGLQETSIYLLIQISSGVLALLGIGLIATGYGLMGAFWGNFIYVCTFAFTHQAVRKLGLSIQPFLRQLLIPVLALTTLAVLSSQPIEPVLRWTLTSFLLVFIGWQFSKIIQQYRTLFLLTTVS